MSDVQVFSFIFICDRCGDEIVINSDSKDAGNEVWKCHCGGTFVKKEDVED